MKKIVLIDEQVRQFIRSLSPEPRKALRHALTGLEDQQGNIKLLDREFDGLGLFRLRVGAYRVIFFHSDCSTIKCVYADCRREVYVQLTSLINGKKIPLPAGFYELPHPPSVKPQPESPDQA